MSVNVRNRGDIFSESQRKGGNLRSYDVNSMDKHEVHKVVGVQGPGTTVSDLVFT